MDYSVVYTRSGEPEINCAMFFREYSDARATYEELCADSDVKQVEIYMGGSRIV